MVWDGHRTNHDSTLVKRKRPLGNCIFLKWGRWLIPGMTNQVKKSAIFDSWTDEQTHKSKSRSPHNDDSIVRGGGRDLPKTKNNMVSLLLWCGRWQHNECVPKNAMWCTKKTSTIRMTPHSYYSGRKQKLEGCTSSFHGTSYPINRWKCHVFLDW